MVDAQGKVLATDVFGWVGPEPRWWENSRLALTFAWVEHHTSQIDRYYKRADLETGDVAEYKGHYYSDKIIAVSMLGVPAISLPLAMHSTGLPIGVQFATRDGGEAMLLPMTIRITRSHPRLRRA